MKKYLLAICLCTAVLAGGTVIAQDAKDKDKEKKEKMGEYDEIIIRKKGDKDGKLTIEIKDGEVKVNGKPIDEYDDENLSVRRRRTPRVALATGPSRFRSNAIIDQGGSWNFSGDIDDPLVISGTANRAFLGVTTEEEGNDGGAKITSISENSAAEKAGLKKDDIITKVGDYNVENPEDLSRAVRKYKPEEKVTIVYKRDGKENKVTATLGKTQSIARAYGYTTPRAFDAPNFAPLERLDQFHFDWDDENGQYFGFHGRPRLGIKAQDTEEGKGVKVLDVVKESLAEKAGIKEGDIITEFDGKAVNSADQLAEAAADSREKASVKIQIIREGKTQTIEVKTPKKLKTANL